MGIYYTNNTRSTKEGTAPHKLRYLSNQLLLASSMCKLVAGYLYHDFWVNHMHYINKQPSTCPCNWWGISNKRFSFNILHEPNLKIAQMQKLKHSQIENPKPKKPQQKLLALKATTLEVVFGWHAKKGGAVLAVGVGGWSRFQIYAKCKPIEKIHAHLLAAFIQ